VQNKGYQEQLEVSTLLQSLSSSYYLQALDMRYHQADQHQVVIKDIWRLRLHLLHDVLEDKDEQTATQTFFSSQQADGGEETDQEDTRRAKLRIREKAPKLIESVIICYLGLLLLRLPVLSSDIRGWVAREDFAYLNAFKHIPQEMKQRLPVPLRRSLEPSVDPHKLQQFHVMTMTLAAAYQTSYSMVIPAINYPLLLLRCVKELCLPLVIYSGTEKLIKLLNLDFDFSVALKRKIFLSQHPEIKLMCAIIITTKLFFPFDDLRRHPTTATEPAALKLDWAKWAEHYRSTSTIGFDEQQRKDSDEAILATTESDVFGMSNQDMDAYLDWFARTGWLNEEDAKQGREADYKTALYAMFPLQSPSTTTNNDGDHEAEKLERIKAVQASLRPNLVVEAGQEGSGILRPGERYKRYRSIEQMPRLAKVFFEAAGRMVNLELQDMVTAVLQVEMKLGNWAEKKRKEAKRGAVDEDNDVDMQDE